MTRTILQKLHEKNEEEKIRKYSVSETLSPTFYYH